MVFKKNITPIYHVLIDYQQVKVIINFITKIFNPSIQIIKLIINLLKIMMEVLNKILEINKNTRLIVMILIKNFNH